MLVKKLYVTLPAALAVAPVRAAVSWTAVPTVTPVTDALLESFMTVVMLTAWVTETVAGDAVLSLPT